MHETKNHIHYYSPKEEMMVERSRLAAHERRLRKEKARMLTRINMAKKAKENH